MPNGSIVSPEYASKRLWILTESIVSLDSAELISHLEVLMATAY